MKEYKPLNPHKFLPLVKQIVNCIDVKIPAHWDKDDMIGYGILGLMEAIERYQPSKGVKFQTFASIRIRGAIFDALRKDAPVSRNCWDLIRKIGDAINKFSQENVEEISISVIAKELNIDEHKIEEAMESFKFFSHVSLEQSLGFDANSDLKIEDVITAPLKYTPEETVLRNEKVNMLSKAISKLEEKQRRVLTLYYYEELSMKEIASVLEVSVSRVSQIKTAALISLRKIMERDF